jgi:hypothetical protein
VPTGAAASLDRSEVITLALLGQWQRFASERDFYRAARRWLRPYFPTLPSRPQFNRLLRRYRDDIATGALTLASWLQPRLTHEIMDGLGVATRNGKRRGRGWLAGLTDIGWSNRLGWSEGFQLLTVVSPVGTLTGYGIAPANTGDRALAETLFELRQQQPSPLPCVGQTLGAYYVADTGFGGRECEARWAEVYGIRLVCSPQRDSARRWPKPVRRWVAGIRQIVETVHERLLTRFRLEHERPHSLDGFQARLAAKVGLHNFCLWLNQQLGRPLLAIADLIDW